MKNFLIVDDEDNLRDILVSILEDSFDDCHVDQAENGRVALELCQTKKYDYINLDYRMPIMNGEELIKALREDSTGVNYNTPILLLTGFAFEAKDVADKHKLFLMNKPFEADELVKTIKLILSASKAKSL